MANQYQPYDSAGNKYGESNLKPSKSRELEIPTPQQVEAEPVYYHDCPALGRHTRVIEATMANKDGTVVLGRQHKCPFCSYCADEFRPTQGVTVLANGKYAVDMSKAERMVPGTSKEAGDA
jgi:hypothetical protein